MFVEDRTNVPVQYLWRRKKICSSGGSLRMYSGRCSSSLVELMFIWTILMLVAAGAAAAGAAAAAAAAKEKKSLE